MRQDGGLGYFFATFAGRCRQKREKVAKPYSQKRDERWARRHWVNALIPLTEVEKKKGRVPRGSPSLPIVRQTVILS